MAALHEALAGCQHHWQAELGLRFLGLALLVVAWACFGFLELRLAGSASAEPDLAQFGGAALGFTALVGGLALLIEGPGLFRLLPYPRRRLF